LPRWGVLPLQLYTQGVALGYGLFGLSGRLFVAPIFTSRYLQEKQQGIMTTITYRLFASAHEKAPAQICRGLQCYFYIEDSHYIRTNMGEKSLSPSPCVSRVMDVTVEMFKIFLKIRKILVRRIVNPISPTTKPV